MAPLDFSTVIAFLLPGFVTFYSMTYLSPRASEIIAASISKDASAGALLLLVLFSLVAGVVVSAFRGLVLDSLQFKTGVDKPTLDYSKLTSEHTLNAFKEAIANTYRFSQFYGNMLVAMVLLLAGKCRSNFDPKREWLVYSILTITIIVLFCSHRKQLDQTYKTLAKILS
jgi:hypothetical protein